MEATVNTLKALCSETRLRLIRLLLERELCVCNLMDALHVPQYHVSHHLSVLKRAGLVRDRRVGTWAHYSLSPDLSQEQRSLLAAACACIESDPAVRDDFERACNDRPRVKEGGCCKKAVGGAQ